jgi:hypothetical protein
MIVKTHHVDVPAVIPEPYSVTVQKAKSSLRLAFSSKGAFGPYIAPLPGSGSYGHLYPQLISARALEMYTGSDFKVAVVEEGGEALAGEPAVQKIENAVRFMDSSIQKDRRLANTFASDARRQNDYGTALYHDFRAAILGDQDAQKRVDQSLQLLEEKMVEARALRDAGNREEAVKLLKKIVTIFGAAAYEASTLLPPGD